MPTHEVVNVPPHQGDQDLWAQDIALQHWTNIQGGSIHTEYLANVGQTKGRYEIFEKANQAYGYVPELEAFDRVWYENKCRRVSSSLLRSHGFGYFPKITQFCMA